LFWRDKKLKPEGNQGKSEENRVKLSNGKVFLVSFIKGPWGMARWFCGRPWIVIIICLKDGKTAPLNVKDTGQKEGEIVFLNLANFPVVFFGASC
jgi:hypothetical protein